MQTSLPSLNILGEEPEVAKKVLLTIVTRSIKCTKKFPRLSAQSRRKHTEFLSPVSISGVQRRCYKNRKFRTASQVI